jgi:hypothetical protein
MKLDQGKATKAFGPRFFFLLLREATIRDAFVIFIQASSALGFVHHPRTHHTTPCLSV